MRVRSSWTLRMVAFESRSNFPSVVNSSAHIPHGGVAILAQTLLPSQVATITRSGITKWRPRPLHSNRRLSAGSTLTLHHAFRGEPLHGARRQNQVDRRRLQSSEEIDVVESVVRAEFQEWLRFRISVESVVEFARGVEPQVTISCTERRVPTS